MDDDTEELIKLLLAVTEATRKAREAQKDLLADTKRHKEYFAQALTRTEKQVRALVQAEFDKCSAEFAQSLQTQAHKFAERDAHRLVTTLRKAVENQFLEQLMPKVQSVIKADAAGYVKKENK